MDISYALEKFDVAVDSLAEWDGPIQQRLESAYIAIHTITPEDVPDELRDDVRWIESELTKVSGQGGEGSLSSTLAQMSSEQGESIARRIISVRAGLASHLRKDV